MKKLKTFLIFTIIIITGLLLARPVLSYTSLVPLMRNGFTVYHYNTSDPVMIPDTYEELDTEFRGVWVATVYNLNMPIHTSQTQYQDAFRDLLDEVKESNMNAILFQVRPLNDAFYTSDYAPWSRYLTGTEGTDPGWDVLGWMISEAHANGIEFHAWMNPYRVANTTMSQTDYINTLTANNFAKLRPDLVVSGNVDSNGRNPLILNPGEPEVKTYIRNVVMEIVTDYDVDGIHFDDYFYPYSGISSDTTTYETYKLDGQAIADWRRENVNDVVRGIKEDLDAFNTSSGRDVRFGISPFGIWQSGGSEGSNTASYAMESYHDQFADSKRWVEEGWLDYICPQIYWNFEHTAAPYADVVDWWAQVSRGTGVDVYIGHAPSSASSQGWITEEISDQLRYNQQHPEIKGEVMYSAAYLDHTHMQYVETHNWTVTPLYVQETDIPDITVSIDGTSSGNIYIEDVMVTLSSGDTIFYQLDGGLWTEYTSPFAVTGEGAHVIYLKTVDSFGNESAISSQNIAIQYINADIPEISISGEQISGNYVVGSAITVTSAGTDIYVAINHGSVGEFELYTGPIVLDDDGSYYIRAKTIDSRGAESDEVTLSVTLTEACYLAPTISIEGMGNDPYYQSATITLTGETTIEYQINDGAWTDYSVPLELTIEGDYNINYRNKDACLVSNTKLIVIDTTPPSDATVTITGDYDGERYYTSFTTVELTPAALTDTVRFRLHNGTSWSTWTDYSLPIELLYSATYTLEYYSVDAAMNESEHLSERIRLDIPPSETNPYVIRNGQQVTYFETNIPIELPTTYVEDEAEIRAIWVATVSNIDIGLHTSEAQYKQAIITMLDTIEANNFNTMFFQVRPMNDAFYDSDYAPWSRYLTGTEGGDPGWDVLAFIIEEAHKRGIEFHAWLNPYRVSTGTEDKATQLAMLHEDNFARQNPDLVIADSAGKLILNPGERQVQVYIRNVIQELMTLYDVDGIHFDDYFYSYNGTPTSADSELYERTKEPDESLADWRRENINTVVREVFEAVENYNTNQNKTVEFGISPFGIWQSGGLEGSNTATYTMESYHDQYADTLRWVEEGWVHYILPQLYWEFDHSAAPFADLVDWWAALCEANDVDLIIGHGFYRYDDDAWDDVNELPEQLRYITKYDVIIGSSFFSYRTLLSYDTEVIEFLDRLNNYYWTEYVTFTWPSTVEKEPDPTCPYGQEYIDGQCQDICPYGQEYIDGQCQDICPYGQEYIDDQCQDICPYGQEYIDDQCQDICPYGQEYIDDECQDICPYGQEYIDDECQDICPYGQEYIDDECQDICPYGQEYIDDQCQDICPYGQEYIDDQCQDICDDEQRYVDGECVWDACQEGYERVEGECVLISEPEPTGCGWFNAIFMSVSGLVTVLGFVLIRRWFW